MLLGDGDLQWTVEPCHPPMRVDQYLKIRLPSYPRAALQRYIRNGGVKRIGLHSGELLPLKPASKVRPGDLLRIRRPSPRGDDLVETFGPPPVLYEDSMLLIVSKPPGMLVHPSGARTRGTLIGLLREAHGPDLDLAHRLDRETSGLVILTRTREANRLVKAAFKQRKVKKRYLAVTRGCPSWDATTVELPIGPSHGPVRVRQMVRQDGYPATTHFEVVRRLSPNHALLAAEPVSGRLHQIRVHLEALGCPVFGDKIYGGDGTPFLEFYEHGLTPALVRRLGHWRHALHAAELRFIHPMDKREICVQSPLPEDLVSLMARLVGRDLEPDAPDDDRHHHVQEFPDHATPGRIVMSRTT